MSLENTSHGPGPGCEGQTHQDVGGDAVMTYRGARHRIDLPRHVLVLHGRVLLEAEILLDRHRGERLHVSHASGYARRTRTRNRIVAERARSGASSYRDWPSTCPKYFGRSIMSG